MAQQCKKKIKVRCKLDDTVYVIDRQSLIKTYISRIVLKQWFTKEGVKKNKTTYCIPDDEVGEQAEKTKFVLDDFGKIIFTSYNSAMKKFKKRSKYAKDNQTPTGEDYEDPTYEWNYINPTPPPSTDYYEEIDNAPDGYIKVNDTGGNKESDQTPTAPDTSEKVAYYDTSGKRVYPGPDGTFIDVKGDVIKVNYYDPNGNVVIHRGTYLGKGEYVYENGTLVPKGVKILRYMELYGNASIKDGIQIGPITDDDVPERIDMDTDTEITD